MSSDVVSGLYKKATHLRTQGNFREAVTLLDRVISLDAGMAEAFADRCGCYFDLHEYAKAIEDANKAIALAPEMVSPLVCRAGANCHLGRSELAIADLNEAVRLAPEDPWIYRERSHLFFNVGDYRAAIADAERFLERRPEDANAYFARAWPRFCLGELDSALADIDEALRRERNSVGFMQLRVQILLSMDRIDEASAELEAAVAQNPKLKLEWLRGSIALKQGNYREAIEQFDAVLATESPTVRVCHDRGLAWYRLGEYENALRDLDEAANLQPEHKGILYLRAELLCLLGRIEESSAIYEGFLAQKGETDEERWDWLGGAIAFRQGNCREAISHFDAVLEAHPNVARLYSDRGEVWYQMKEYERAWSDFDKAVALAPNHAVYCINRANALIGLRRYADANRDLLEAMRLAPDCVHSCRYLAWFRATSPEVEFRNGTEAVALAQKALELAGGQPDWRLCEALAAAHAECGDFNEAIRWQTKVLATAPEEHRPGSEAILEGFRAGTPHRMGDRRDHDW